MTGIWLITSLRRKHTSLGCRLLPHKNRNLVAFWEGIDTEVVVSLTNRVLDPAAMTILSNILFIRVRYQLKWWHLVHSRSVSNEVMTSLVHSSSESHWSGETSGSLDFSIPLKWWNIWFTRFQNPTERMKHLVHSIAVSHWSDETSGTLECNIPLSSFFTARIHVCDSSVSKVAVH